MKTLAQRDVVRHSYPTAQGHSPPKPWPATGPEARADARLSRTVALQQCNTSLLSRSAAPDPHVSLSSLPRVSPSRTPHVVSGACLRFPDPAHCSRGVSPELNGCAVARLSEEITLPLPPVRRASHRDLLRCSMLYRKECGQKSSGPTDRVLLGARLPVIDDTTQQVHRPTCLKSLESAAGRSVSERPAGVAHTPGRLRLCILPKRTRL
jgi:hypothetical protein